MNNVQTQYQPRGATSREIADDLEAAIRSGSIGPRQRLTPIREAAMQLGTSPATVASAYRRLRERGLVVAQGRRGTVVARRARGPAPQMGSVSLSPAVKDLRSGSPALELLPNLATVFAGLSLGPALAARDERNDAALLAAAAERYEADAIPADALAVVGGALDGIERLVLGHAKSGDTVAIEDPTYPPVIDLLLAANLTPRPIALDREGMLPASLAAALDSGVAAVIITPRAQNPTGAALSEGRARELRALLRGRPETLVIEDDHMAGIAGAPSVSVAADREVERWAVVRSVSKTLGPDLRLAMVSGDERTIDRLQQRQNLGTGWVSTILQRLVADLWSAPETDDLIATAAAAYADRRSRLRKALEDRGIESVGDTGMNIWVPVEREAPVVERLQAEGWAVSPGEAFRINAGPALRVTVSRLGDGDEWAFADALGRALKATDAPRSY